MYDSYSSSFYKELSISETLDYDLKPSKDLNPVIKRSDSSDDSIKLIIIFSTNNEKQFYPIRKNISVKTTINEIIKIVSNERGISDKITINYKLDGKLEELLPNQTIEQVKNRITEKDVNRKEGYYVYVKIQSKSKTKKINSFDVESEDIIELKTSNLLHDESSPKKTVRKPRKKISPKVTYECQYDSDSLSYFDISVSKDDYGDDKKSFSLYKKEMKPEVSKLAEIDIGKDRLRKSDSSNDSKSKTKLSEEKEKNNQNSFKTTNRKNISKVTPKKIPISTMNSNSYQTKIAVQKSSFYTFEFDGEEKQIKLQDESTLELEEEKIKDEFNISPNEQLLFKFVCNDDHTEEVNIFKEMNLFKNGTIHIYIYLKCKPILIIDEEYMANFKIIKEIKIDEYVKIYKICSKINSETYILKVMNKISIENLKNLLKEHEILRKLDHPYILKTHGIFMGNTNDPPAIICEYNKSNLQKLMKEKKLNNTTIFEIIYSIAEGMRFVHFNNIIHRNLNPQNIIINDKGVVKIGEFGISKEMPIEEQIKLSSKDILGDLKYISPELINDENYDKKVDVYSFGILILFLLNEGHLPKSDTNNVLKISGKFTKYAKEFISRCISVDPSQRPSFDDICNELSLKYTDLMEITEEEENEIKTNICRIKAKIPKY